MGRGDVIVGIFAKVHFKVLWENKDPKTTIITPKEFFQAQEEKGFDTEDGYTHQLDGTISSKTRSFKVKGWIEDEYAMIIIKETTSSFAFDQQLLDDLAELAEFLKISIQPQCGIINDGF